MEDDPNEGYLQFALKGVWPARKCPTLNPRIWLCYLAWTIYSYLWLRVWWLQNRRGWREGLLSIIRRFYPGHMSHRSDWTDATVGALYAGKLEGWSEQAFEQFLENIDSLGERRE